MLVEMLNNQLNIQDWSTKEMSGLKIYVCKLIHTDAFKAIKIC